LKAPLTDQEQIKSYLLGQLPEEDGSEVEARLLTDREFCEELSIGEDDLVEQYLSGALSSSERQAFESHFVLSPERQQKVRFARALKKYVSAGDEEEQENPIEIEAVPERGAVTPFPGSRPKIFPFRNQVVASLAAALVLIVVVGGGLILMRVWQTQRGTGRALAVELSPRPATRGEGEVKQLSLAPDVGSVRLQLDLPKNEYPSYEAAVRDSSLRTVLTTKDLKPQPIDNFSALMLDVKADLLTPGDYRVHVSGTTPEGRSESVATFSFKITPPQR